MAATTRSPAQTLALIIGVVYLLVGLAGFILEPGTLSEWVGQTDHRLLGIFEINGLHNLVHLLVGVAGIALARTLPGARTYGLALLVAYGLVAIYGFIVGNDDAILSLNAADNWLHLFSAVLGAVIIAMTGRSATTRTV